MKATFLITDATSKILYASPGSEERSGFDIPEMIGRKPGEIWGGLMSRHFYETFWREIKRGNPYIECVENRRKNGERYLDNLHVVPVSDESDTIRFFLEMHPIIPSSADKRNFERDFFRYGKRAAHPGGIATLLNAWMNQSIRGRITSRKTLLDIIFQQYIQPTEETYMDRKDDRELIIDAKRSPENFAKLYEKYHSRVYIFFLHRVDSEAQAEDCAHEVFMRAFKALPKYTPSNASYLTYLLRISHNLLVSNYRKSAYRELPQAEAPDVSERIERRDVLKRGLSSLSAEDRELMRMKYEYGLKIKEIAGRLGKSQNAVKLRLSRARKKIRQNIEKGG